MTSSASSSGSGPIVLAFSGGLDTSFCIPWLKETYKRPVVTVDPAAIHGDRDDRALVGLLEPRDAERRIEPAGEREHDRSRAG